MSNEVIKIPIKVYGWEFCFIPENQTVILRQTKTQKSLFSELVPELSELKNFNFEISSNLVLEVELIKEISKWLNTFPPFHANCRTRMEGIIEGIDE